MQSKVPAANAHPQDASVPLVALAEGSSATAIPDTANGEPFTWAYLASIAGTAAFALLFVQFFKVPLDRIWKIPTRVFVYIICLATMLHTIATGNMTPSYRVLPDGTVREVYFYCVDISEFTVNKLSDRGSLSAPGIVTNVQDFVFNVCRGLGLQEESARE